MTDLDSIAVEINGRKRRADVLAGTTLLTVLRDEIQITSPKRGCNQGVCGACTVEVDGWPVRACLLLAAACEGKAIKTLEGLKDPVIAALQEQFLRCGAIQCGFCTSGVLMVARSMLQQNPCPAVEDVQVALSGNICRCTGYRKIVDAVMAAARELRA